MTATVSKRTFYISILIFVVIVIWLSSAIARLEAFHYSVQTGGCGEVSADPVKRMKTLDCLDKEEPRTSPVYDLFYGLRIM